MVPGPLRLFLLGGEGGGEEEQSSVFPSLFVRFQDLFRLGFLSVQDMRSVVLVG